MTAAAARRPVDVVTSNLDLALADARAAACRALTGRDLIALAGAPRWTPAALTAVGVGVAALAGPAAALVLRAGRGDDEVIELDPGALPAIRAALAGHTDAPVAVVRELGARLAAAGDQLELPPALAAWRDLAVGLTAGVGELAERLRREVADACDRGRPGQALDRLEAAAALERVIGGPLAVAVRIGRHRVEYAQHLARDRRQLAAFVPRRDASAAVDALLAEGGPWALHLLGVGGVGKTTLLRHLAVGDGGDGGRPGLTVARIDFDYLSPSYPGTNPGLLVEAIVHELTARIDRGEQDRWLRSIDEQLIAIADLAAVSDGGDPLAAVAWGPFQRLLSFVGSLLGSLPRPLLVLDTCEELMKLAPVAGRVPSVEATFRLIEELHERCPTLRVIFAGRRLLAQRGHGWSAPAAAAGALTSPRDYLALHELRGFDAGEAEAALARLLPASRRDDRALITAILAAAPEDERASEVERPARPDAAADAAPRFSPFRVAAFGAWIAGEPTLPVARLTDGGADPYIEHRIVRRMGPLEGLLPVVALLRRFDAATLAAVTGAPDEAAETMEALAGHEWLDVDRDPARGLILTGKRSVVTPLERYLAVARPDAWAAARRAVATGLAPRLGEADAVALPVELIEAALRALDGAAAARAWLTLEAGIGAAWSTARSLTRSVLGERAAAEDGATLLGAAVRATQASALIHLEPTVDVTGLWQEVEASASDALDDDDAVADAGASARVRSGGAAPAWLLLQRARLGQVTAAAWSSAEQLRDQLDPLLEVLFELTRWQRVDALACPLIAALEAVVERAERLGGVDDKRLTVLAGQLGGLTLAPPGLQAFATMLRARIEAMSGTMATARRLADEAWRAATAPDGAALPATTLDWLPPSSLAARLGVERVRLAFHAPPDATDPAPASADGPVPPPAADALDADSEHLRVALGLYAEARRRAPLAALPTTTPARTLPYAARARFPLEAYAIALDRDGRLPETARARLSERGQLEAVGARALFTLDHEVLVERSALLIDPASVDAEPVAIARAVTLLESVGPGAGPLARAWTWQVAATRAQLDELVRAGRRQLEELTTDAAVGDARSRLQAAAALDELIELSRYTVAPISGALARLPDPTAPRVHGDQHDDTARGALRAWAGGRFVYPPPAERPTALATWLAGLAAATPRRFAQLAHDEGQLVALRLPARAIALLDLAARTYDVCDDAVGAAAARLGAEVARRRAGEPAAIDADAVVAALPADARPLVTPLADRLAGRAERRVATGSRPPVDVLARFERGPRRKPSRQAEVESWWRRRGRDAVGWMGVGAVILVVLAGVALFIGYGPGWLAAGLRRIGFPYATEVVSITLLAAVVYGLFQIRTPIAWIRGRSRRGRVRRLVLAGQVRRASAGEAVVTLDAPDGDLALTLGASVPRVGRPPAILGEVGPTGMPASLAALVHPIAAIHPSPVGVPLSIVVDPALTAHAWDGMLLGAHPLLAETFAVRRMVPVARAPRRARTAGVLHASVATRSLLGAGLAGPGVGHVVGRPVRGAYSIAIDLDDGAEAATPPRAPADLIVPDLALVVLQGAPQAASEVPTDALRSEVGLLRELGVALIALGVAEVLVLPPLPEVTMVSLLEALRRPTALDPALPARRDHLAMAHAARQHLRAIDDVAHRAAALEVTLMVASASLAPPAAPPHPAEPAVGAEDRKRLS